MVKKLVSLVGIVVSFLILTSFAFAQVEITDIMERGKKGQYKGGKFSLTERLITIDNGGPVNYSLYYAYINDPAFKEKYPNKPFPYLYRDWTRSSNLGLGGAAWCSAGFMDVIAGKDLRFTVCKEIKVVEKGKRGVVDVVWEHEKANIKARFIILPGDDKVYLKVSVDPKIELSKIRVCFLATLCPCIKEEDWYHWISTASRSISRKDQQVSNLDPQTEPWVFIFDSKKNRRGTCALMYLPEEAKKVSVTQVCGTFVDVIYPGSIKEMRFILWNFPKKYKSVEEVYLYLKENGEKFSEELRNMSFSDKLAEYKI